jgi:DNA segregation ATPase FtsK/SpoIIIE-like protein
MKTLAHDTFGAVGSPVSGNPVSRNPLSTRAERNGFDDSFTPQNGFAQKTTAKAASKNTASGSKNPQPEQQSGSALNGNHKSDNTRKPNRGASSQSQWQSALAFCVQYKREITAVMLALCAFLVLLALVSYDPADHASLHSTASLSLQQQTLPTAPRTVSSPATQAANEYITKNWLGIAGANLAHVVYAYTVGYSALAFPVLMMLWAVALYRRSVHDKLMLGTALALVGTALVASFAGVLQLVNWMPPMRPEWSGSVGQFIARMLWQVIGTVGAFIVLTLGLLAALFTALDLNIEQTIARFKAEKLRFSAMRNSAAASAKQHVQAERDNYRTGGATEAATPTATSFDESFTKNFDDEILNDHSERFASNDIASAGTKADTERADADEPARILRRNADSDVHFASLRRDLITKYTDETVLTEELSAQSEREVSVAPRTPSAPVPTVPEKRGVPEKQGIPHHSVTSTISISTAQTTVHAPNFAYPAQASITFVEDVKKNDSFDEVVNDTPAHTPVTAQTVVSDEMQRVERRNTEHLAGLVAGQVAGQVADEVANTVARQVATEVAEHTVKEAIERITEQVRGRISLEQTLVVNEQRSAQYRNSEDTSLSSDNDSTERDVLLQTPVPIRTNTLNVIARPMFLPANDLDEHIHYTPPTLELLVPQELQSEVNPAELQEKARILQDKLRTFRIEIEDLQVTPGPVVTQYEFVPAAGVKVAQIENLSGDIALALKARGIRIIAPVPGRGTVAVEIPNDKPLTVRFSSIVDSGPFQDSLLRLPLALGKTIEGDVFCADLAKMPHLLIAGATGAGKSVGINSIIASLLYKIHPRNLKFVIIDPKKVEMTQYRALENHFLAVCPDIDEKIITKAQNAVIALKSVVAEMERRYNVLAKVGQRNIVDYNQKISEGKYKDTSEMVHQEMPYIVVIVDELADLMMTASRDVEEPICRLAQLARAVGIHLIVATQRPSVDVVTGLIKANFPARIAYQVASKIDSRTILDAGGAELLLGNGDMLFTGGGAGKPQRLQNSYLSTDEVERICDHISNQQGYSQPYFLPSVSEKTQRGGGNGNAGDERDELFDEAARLVVRHQQSSTSLLQRRMKIGYSRAARVMDQLEEAGIIGAFDGSKGRSVLIDEAALESILE